MKEDMMNDAIDDVLGDEEDDEERSEKLVWQKTQQDSIRKYTLCEMSWKLLTL